jgi:hypothetical protein
MTELREAVAHPEVFNLLRDLERLHRTESLPHGTCGVFIGQRCNCYLSNISRWLDLAEAYRHDTATV